MNDIEQIKIDLTLKKLAGTLKTQHIAILPVDDDIRSFVCSLGPMYARVYASYVDKKPRNETREASCNDPEQAYWYALYIDKGPSDITRNAAYKHEHWRRGYQTDIDKTFPGAFLPGVPNSGSL